MSWIVEVELCGVEGSWHGNRLVFSTQEEATRYACHLSSRWSLVSNSREVPCDLPATHTTDRNGMAIRIGQED